MKFSPAIERKIVDQITREPDRPVILPDWAYWAGTDTAYIYVNRMPVPLIHYLRELLIGDVTEDEGVVNLPDVDTRNVNPYLAVVTPTMRSRPVCPNGHRYTEDDFIPGVGHRCQACRVEKLKGTPSVVDKNRSKTTCPEGHRLVRRPNGRRRCFECPRKQSAAYRRKKGTSNA